MVCETLQLDIPLYAMYQRRGIAAVSEGAVSVQCQVCGVGAVSDEHRAVVRWDQQQFNAPASEYLSSVYIVDIPI